MLSFWISSTKLISIPSSQTIKGGSLVVWPLHYLEKGKNRAVVGGWDPSARKFFKTDELSFTVPFGMFTQMTERYKDSFLTTKT
ncbi:MAG: DUF169 domain-containing protein, partial [Desulfobacula sp.]|nr:DUF169 domain-containing protein [Desulfobacula sp.]